MPRTRSTRIAASNSLSSRQDAVRRAAVTAVEPLEGRRLFTTLTGGQSFDFLAGDSETVIRVRLSGNITAEFLALEVNPDTNATRVVNLVPAPPEDSEDDDDILGADLFNIYVSSSDETGSIYIAEIPELGAPDREALPFAGDTGDIRINRNNDGESVITNLADTGTVWIGARSVDIEAIDGNDEAAVPFVFSPGGVPTGIPTARPNRTDPLVAGIETARGVGMGNLFVGGVVTGRVFIDGDLGEFYAGGLLTGDARGLVGSDAIPPETTQLQNNFFVAGNLPSLTVKESVGTTTIASDASTEYRTGVDMKVGGKLGNAYVGGDFLAGLEVVNNPDVSPITASIAETESNGNAGSVFFQGGLVGLDVAGNNDRDTPQYLPSISSDQLDRPRVLEVAGSINPQAGDGVDNYALPLLAGQRVQIKLTSLSPLLPAQVGLYDPDGRLVRTDLSRFGDALNQIFEYVATTPGTFVLAVAQRGDNDFNGGTSTSNGSPYRLEASNYGEVAVGGLHVLGNAAFLEADAAVLVRNGDTGVVRADGTMLGGGNALTTRAGNLRAVVGQEIAGIDLSVPRGSVGRVETTAADMNINPNAATGDEPVLAARIGGEYQLVSSAGSFVGNLVAAGAIGTLRITGTYGEFRDDSSFPGVLRANADDSGSDGTIDLIDVGADLGSADSGGPAIFTGTGGNLRYLTVNGTVYRDALFGGGEPDGITAPLGQSVTVTDDSGTDVVLTPNTRRTSGTGGASTITQGQLTVVTYGLRSGGSAIVSVTSTQGLSVTASGNAGTAEIGRINLAAAGSAGDGTALTYNATQNRVQFSNTAATGGATTSSLQPATPLDLLLSGDRGIDVFDVRGGNVSRISNSGSGEIVNINVAGLGYLTGDSLGVARTSTAAAIIPRADAGRFQGTAFPFNDQRSGINVAGNVISVITAGGLGNFFAGNVVDRVITNSDGVNVKGVFDGIAGPIVANRFNSVFAGEGVLPSQNGDGAAAGIFAAGSQGIIGTVTADKYADIRGPVVATRQINAIALDGGSIIDTVVGQLPTLSGAGVLNSRAASSDTALGAPATGTTVGTSVDSLARPIFEVGRISVEGGGGILGSVVQGADVGPITISGGFGLLNSIISTGGQDVFSGVTTDGLGIRGVRINGGAATGSIIAQGTTGRLLDVTGYSRSVRQSAVGRFDRFTGRTIDPANDLHAFLGTSDKAKKVSGVTNEGIIEDSLITGSRGLKKLEAYTIRSSNLRTPSSSSLFPMRISFANDITSVRAYGNIEGLNVTSGGIEDLNVNGNVSHTSLNIAGRIASVVVGRSVKGTSSFVAGGPNGELQKLYVGRSMYGNIAAAVGIGSATIGRELGSSSFRSFGNINSMTVGGSVVTGAYVRANRTIRNLNIGGDIQENSTLRARSITNQSIKGTVFGDLVIS